MVMETLTLSSGMPSNKTLHVFHAVNGDARLANVARHARVVAVVAAVGREVKGNAEAP